ncbi:MAG: hypothetical protein LBF59_08270 [Prevotellaceae bacterium]|nr:hypothetical protein [Prevotellaceae bacterium]
MIINPETHRCTPVGAYRIRPPWSDTTKAYATVAMRLRPFGAMESGDRSFRRALPALPYAIDNKAFSLILTTMTARGSIAYALLVAYAPAISVVDTVILY